MLLLVCVGGYCSCVSKVTANSCVVGVVLWLFLLLFAILKGEVTLEPFADLSKVILLVLRYWRACG